MADSVPIIPPAVQKLLWQYPGQTFVVVLILYKFLSLIVCGYNVVSAAAFTTVFLFRTTVNAFKIIMSVGFIWPAFLNPPVTAVAVDCPPAKTAQPHRLIVVRCAAITANNTRCLEHRESTEQEVIDNGPWFCSKFRNAHQRQAIPARESARNALIALGHQPAW